MEENKEKNYLEITPDAEKLIGKILKIGNELSEYFGTESMFEPNRTKESLYFLFAINEESSNLDVMFELDLYLNYDYEILANQEVCETYQNNLFYKLQEFYNVLYNLNIQKTKTETMSKKEFFKKFYKKYKKHTGVNNVKKEIKYSYVW
jgi:hypothetical protein